MSDDSAPYVRESQICSSSSSRNNGQKRKNINAEKQKSDKTKKRKLGQVDDPSCTAASDPVTVDEAVHTTTKGFTKEETDDKTPRRSQPLHGKVIAVSTQQQSTQESTTPSNNTGSCSIGSSSDVYTYKSVCAMCVRAGATITGQVHKKVLCVVATPEAAGHISSGTTSFTQSSKFGCCPTQRVRKAWKRNVPVVAVQWVMDCQERNLLLPMEEKYLWMESSQHASGSSSSVVGAKNKHSSKATGATISHPIERIVELGCCCVCHENEPSNSISDCEWCVDCDVNQAAATTKKSPKMCRTMP